MADKFTISLHSNGYYSVSVPNYQGGEVVRAENYDALKQDHAVQAESITHLQSQLRVMKEAMEQALLHLQDCGYKTNKQVQEQLIAAITPKGSE